MSSVPEIVWGFWGGASHALVLYSLGTGEMEEFCIFLSMSRSFLSDITPLTLLDYPGKAACIFWFSACKFRCKYCYNPQLVLGHAPEYGIEKALEFLTERVGFLDGVVLSGGECTLYPDLMALAEKIKSLGYLIKMDTNGSNPAVVRKILEAGLIDYLALDYKAPEYLFGEVTERPRAFFHFSKTLDYLIQSEASFEVRTTVHHDLLKERDVNHIIEDLYGRGYQGTYYLQNYFHTDSNLGCMRQSESSFDTGMLAEWIPVKLRNFPDTLD